MKKVMATLIALICAITMCLSGTCSVFAAGEVSTAYGTIPADYADASAYPFAVFKSDGSFVGAYNVWASNTNTGALPNCPNGGIILLRRNFDAGWADKNMMYANLCYDTGSKTIDLGGYEFNLTLHNTQSMFNYFAKGAGGTLNIVVKNGTIVYGRNSVIGFSQNANGKSNTVNFTFDNVTFKDTTASQGGSPQHKIISYGAAAVEDYYTTSSVNFNNCTFDITSLLYNYSLFESGEAGSSVKMSMTVKGGNIIASSSIYNTWTAVNNDASSITFVDNNEGKKTTLTVPTGAVIPSAPVVSGEMSYSWQGGIDNNGSTVYSLGGSIQTEYGTIPEVYADASAYPFLVFGADGSFAGAYNAWASSTSTGALPRCPDGGTVLLRRNYDAGWVDNNMKYQNLCYDTGSKTIDLGGYEFNLTQHNTQSMFEYLAKGAGGTLNIVVKNGTIVYGRNSVIGFSQNANGKSNTANFTFDNVTFKDTTASQGGSPKHKIISYGAAAVDGYYTTSSVNFNNCTFDITSLLYNYPLFESGEVGSSVKMSMTVKGGNIIASSSIYNTWTAVNNDASSIVFADDNEGKKTTLTVPNGTTIPSTTVISNGVNYLWQNGVAGEVNTVYTLGGGIQTEYGMIPDAYADISAYPFAVFGADGSFKGAYNAWASNASTGALPQCPDGGIVLLRRNYDAGWVDNNMKYQNLCYDTGSKTIDLGGYEFNLTQHNTQSMFEYLAKGAGGTLNIVVKNGTIVYGRNSVIGFSQNANGKSNTANFTFDNVTFKDTTASQGGSPKHKIISYGAAAVDGYYTTSSVNFNNCTFDITSLLYNYPLFESGEAGSSVKMSMTVKGGNIIASSSVYNTWTAVNNDASSITFVDNNDGKKITLTVPTGSNITNEPIKSAGTYYVFGSPVNGGESVVYNLVVADDYEIYRTNNTVQVYNVKGACTLYVASYASEKEIVSIVTAPVSSDSTVDISDKISGDAAFVKVFLWNDMCKPLCVAQ